MNGIVDFSQMAKLGKGSAPRDEEAREEAEMNFRTKVAMQQFMNHTGPLFRAFAFKGVDVVEVRDGDMLLKPTSDANALTRLVAAEVMGKPVDQITPRDAAFFRTEAANWVANRWIRDEPYDIATAAHQIASATKLAGRDWDHDPFKDDRISNDASLMMSAAGVTSVLMDQVAVYDFRMGKNEVLKVLLDAVIGTSISVAAEMLPNAPKNDIANLIQTVSRNFSSIMEAIYERKAREVVSLLEKREPSQRVAWLEANRPLDGIVADFREWSLCFVAFAVATSKRIASPVPAEPRAGMKNDR